MGVLVGYGRLFLATMLLPLLLAGVAAIAVSALRFAPLCMSSRHAAIATSALLMRLVYALGPLFYIPLTRANLAFFDCTLYPNGVYYLDAEPAFECFSAEWWHLFPLALVCFFVYVLALPSLFAVKLYRSREHLFDASVVASLGPLYVPYRRKYYLYEVALLGKRLAVVIVSLFFSSSAIVLLAVLTAVFIGAGAYQLRHAPFFVPAHNLLENQLNLAFIIILQMGALFWADNFPNDYVFWGAICVLLLAILLVLVALVRAAVVDLAQRRLYKKGAHTNVFSPHDNRLLAELADHVDDIQSHSLQTKVLAALVERPLSLPPGAVAPLATSNARFAESKTFTPFVHNSSDDTDDNRSSGPGGMKSMQEMRPWHPLAGGGYTASEPVIGAPPRSPMVAKRNNRVSETGVLGSGDLGSGDLGSEELELEDFGDASSSSSRIAASSSSSALSGGGGSDGYGYGDDDGSDDVSR